MSPSATAAKPAALSVRQQVTAEEWKVRVDLAACYRLVALYGWDDLVFTHISVRVPGPEHHFLINPYGMMFEEITASSLIKVDLDGKIVMPTVYPFNPAGFTIHSAIHAAREDAQCVLHLHTIAGVAVSCQKGGLKAINQTSMAVQPMLAYHEYEGIALDHDERPRLVRDLGDKPAMLLWNHGTLTVGRTVADAFLTMYNLERACQMQVTAQGGGAELHLPSAASQTTVAQQAKGFGSMGGLAWPALLRKLDRIDPSYRD